MSALCRVESRASAFIGSAWHPPPSGAVRSGAGEDLTCFEQTVAGDPATRPTIDAQGNLSVSVRVDKRITAALNVPGAFTGKVNNSANIGKTTDEFVGMWNEEHPEDPISLTPPSQN